MGQNTEQLLSQALDNLRAEEKDILTTIDRLYAELKEHQTQLEYKQRKISGIEWLLKAETDKVTTITSFDEDVFTARSPKDIKNNIADILADENGDLHYKHIYERLLKRGIKITGKDPLQNLLSYLSRDDRFVRVDKGTYTLSEEALKQYRLA